MPCLLDLSPRPSLSSSSSTLYFGSPAHTNSRFLCPRVTCIGMHAPDLHRFVYSYIPVLSDPEASTDIQDIDSIYITVSPSMPRLLDLSPPPSLSSSSSSLYFGSPAHTNSRSL